MGTLHEVFQLKPQVISEAAIIAVKKDKQSSFLKKYKASIPEEQMEWKLFANLAGVVSTDGNVEGHSMYSADRIIDMKVPGVYISIQSGSKYGFNHDFDEFMAELAPYLEDTLFFVIWDYIINRFEIENGVLTCTHSKDFIKWDYNFENYLETSYPDSPQIRADYYLDKFIEMQLFIADLIKNDDDPGSLYEVEEYEELFLKLETHKNYIANNRFEEIKNWLNELIIFQRAWEDEFYD